MTLILEGIVTTLNEDGSVNVAPMGPEIDRRCQTFVFKPFATSTTYRNLLRTGQGVFHVTDDVELLARAAIGPLDPLPPLIPARDVEGFILADACRYYAFRAPGPRTSSERARIEAQVVGQGTLREFLGFNRAKHAVVEAAILATRVALLPPAEIMTQWNRLRPLVEKTGGDQESRAFALLEEFVRRATGEARE